MSEAGYHVNKIEKGMLGEISKIEEELNELKDAQQQGVKIMELVELSDLIGAIELYIEKHHAGTTLDDLIKMKDITKGLFKMDVDRLHLTSFEAAEKNTAIDYVKIGAAIDFYKKKGFQYIDVPWDTPKRYRNVTFNGVDFNPILPDRFLVGSAEQSFIYLHDTKKIKRGSYVACTPCFRGDEIDELHQQYFMKVELFDTNDTSFKRLQHIIQLAEDFFSNYLMVRVIQTGEYEYDIETYTGIELGSYGIRRWENHVWIFATGLAEPRLTKSLRLYN